jgi:hypothetical protein
VARIASGDILLAGSARSGGSFECLHMSPRW